MIEPVDKHAYRFPWVTFFLSATHSLYLRVKLGNLWALTLVVIQSLEKLEGCELKSRFFTQQTTSLARRAAHILLQL